MTREQITQRHKEICNEIHETFIKKNADYSGDNQDPFFCFRASELLGLVETETTILSRTIDKVMRAIGFIKRNRLSVSGETIQDTYKDAAGYMIIGALYEESKEDTCKRIG
jgi:hypothetical protein